MIDHDRLFKLLLTTFFYDFLKLFFPAVYRYLDTTKPPEFLQQEVLEKITGEEAQRDTGNRHIADIVAKVRYKESDTYFLVLTETQSYPQDDFGERFFDYWYGFRKTTRLPVYPIVVFSYDSPNRLEPDTWRVAFPDLEVVTFRYRTVPLIQKDWRKFVRKKNPVAAALMAKMRIAPSDRVRVKVECLRLMLTLKLDRDKSRLISGFVETYLRLNAVEQKEFMREAAMFLKPAELEEEFVFENVWTEQGEERGLQKGLQQQAERMVLRQLRHRFGALSEVIEARVHDLSLAQKEALGEALLDFATPGDLDTWLEQNG